MKDWIAVDDGLVVHAGFSAEQSYIDNYAEQVVERADRVTPPWWHEGVEFVDVTSLDPQPVEGWRKARNGRWVAPPPPELTAEEQAARDAAEEAAARRAADDEFVASMRAKIDGGDTLTDEERDRLAVIQAERGALVVVGGG